MKDIDIQRSHILVFHLNIWSLPPSPKKVVLDTFKTYGNNVITISDQVYKQLSSEAKLFPHWTERILRSRTHYASAAVYGGWSFIMYKVVCRQPEHDDIVRKILRDRLGKTGPLSEQTMGNKFFFFFNSLIPKYVYTHTY